MPKKPNKNDNKIIKLNEISYKVEKKKEKADPKQEKIKADKKEKFKIHTQAIAKEIYNIYTDLMQEPKPKAEEVANLIILNYLFNYYTQDINKSSKYYINNSEIDYLTSRVDETSEDYAIYKKATYILDRIKILFAYHEKSKAEFEKSYNNLYNSLISFRIATPSKIIDNRRIEFVEEDDFTQLQERHLSRLSEYKNFPFSLLLEKLFIDFDNSATQILFSDIALKGLEKDINLKDLEKEIRKLLENETIQLINNFKKYKYYIQNEETKKPSIIFDNLKHDFERLDFIKGFEDLENIDSAESDNPEEKERDFNIYDLKYIFEEVKDNYLKDYAPYSKNKYKLLTRLFFTYITKDIDSKFITVNEKTEEIEINAEEILNKNILKMKDITIFAEEEFYFKALPLSDLEEWNYKTGLTFDNSYLRDFIEVSISEIISNLEHFKKQSRKYYFNVYLLYLYSKIYNQPITDFLITDDLSNIYNEMNFLIADTLIFLQSHPLTKSEKSYFHLLKNEYNRDVNINYFLPTLNEVEELKSIFFDFYKSIVIQNPYKRDDIFFNVFERMQEEINRML